MHLKNKRGLAEVLLMILFSSLMTAAGETAERSALPEGFVYVADLIPDAVIEMRYATDHNFTGRPVDGYEGNAAVLTRQAAQALKEAADEFGSMGLHIKIFDAYRPRRAVRAFVKWAEDPEDILMKAEFFPDIGNKQRLLDLEYIARNSSHCKGSAVDLTLTDSEGRELDMGTCFDFFGEKAWHSSRDVTEEQRQNRLLLRTVMEKHGFRAFEREWWHYRLTRQPYPDTNFDFPVK